MTNKPFKQNTLTIGLLETYNSLRESGEITGSDTEMCSELGIERSSFAQVKTGTRNAPDSVIDPFVKRFKLTRQSLILAAQAVTKKLHFSEPPSEYKSSKPVPYFELDVSSGTDVNYRLTFN